MLYAKACAEGKLSSMNYERWASVRDTATRASSTAAASWSKEAASEASAAP
jgi:hypothetical protein